MNESTPYDRIRERELGRLSPPERERLEHELAADPELARFAEEYRLVHQLTAVAEAQRGSRTSYADLEPRLDAARRGVPRVAAAAALLFVAGAAFAAGWALRAPRALALTAIELDEPLLPASSGELPLEWAEFDPRGERGVHFLSDLPQAQRLAGAAHRPLLVYGTYPECPLAGALNELVFTDASVMALVERTVPVHVDLARLDPIEQQSFVKRGYPFLEMWRDDGRTSYSLARQPDPGAFVESLHDGLAHSDATGEQPAWETVRSWTRRLAGARSAELENRLADAEREFRALARDPELPALITDLAARGLLRLSAGARALLFDARAVASLDAAGAQRLLELGCERYAGTSFERDLRAVLARLLRDGRFPELVESDRSV